MHSQDLDADFKDSLRAHQEKLEKEDEPADEQAEEEPPEMAWEPLPPTPPEEEWPAARPKKHARVEHKALARHIQYREWLADQEQRELDVKGSHMMCTCTMYTKR